MVDQLGLQLDVCVFLGIYQQHGNGVVKRHHRQRILDSAHRLAATVPGDQDMALDPARTEAFGHDQDGPATAQNDLFGRIQSGRILRVALPDA